MDSRRVPIHDHSDLNSGGRIANSAVSLLVQGPSAPSTPSGATSGSGSSSLSVTDGVNSVTSVTSVSFRAGSTVSDGGGGQAVVLPSAAARISAYLSFR